MKKRLPVILIIIGLLVGGYFVDRNRAAQQSRLSGYFENQPTQAASRIGGRVKKILVKEGDSVAEGQVLVELETESYAATVEAERQGLNQAEEAYRAAVNGARPEEVRRQESVVAEAQAAFDKVRNGPRREEIASARARLAQAEAMLAKAVRGPRPQEIAAARAAANVALNKLREAERGPTEEERSQLRARLAAAESAVELARKEFERTDYLVNEGARSRQQWDAAKANLDQAESRRRDAGEALQRAMRGTPPEVLAQAREAYRQAQAQAQLVIAGPRREDKTAAEQEAVAARAALQTLQNGSRPEDIKAAEARLQQAKDILDQLRNGTRDEDLKRLKAAVEQAKARVEGVKANLAENTVRAAADGIVDRILVADGDLVGAGTPVVQLSLPQDIWLRVYVPESQLGKVKTGDAAEVRIDGIDGSIAGIVESIATRGEFTPANLQSPEERGRQVFAVRIRLKESDPRVKAGMAATVTKVGQWP